MHESEFIVQKFQKSISVVESFENKVVKLEKDLRGAEEAHLAKFKEISH